MAKNQFQFSGLIFLLVTFAITVGGQLVCECSIEEYYPQQIHRNVDIRCDDLTTQEHLECFGRNLDGIFLEDKLGIRGLRFTTKDTNLDLFTDDYLQSHRVTALKCYFCTLSHMPYGHLCSRNVTSLSLLHSNGIALTSGGFKSCTSLSFLGLQGTNLTEVPPGAFEGLHRLVELDLSNNMIQAVPEFTGIESTLQILDLSNNSISFIPRNAFHGMTKLRILYLRYSNIATIQEGAFDALLPHAHVYFGGNPLKCDCSLKWLQNWYENYLRRTGLEPSTPVKDLNPRCVTPLHGPLRTTDFCNSTTTSSDSSESQDGWGSHLPSLLSFLIFGF